MSQRFAENPRQSRLDDTAAVAPGPREQLRRQLRGLDYREQLELVRPPMPLPAVQTCDDGEQSHEAQLEAILEQSLAYTDAWDQVDEFYANSRELLRLHHAVEQAAIENFKEYVEIDNPPDLGQVLIDSLIGSTFKLVGGYEAIERGLASGLFARSPDAIRDHLDTAVDVAEQAVSADRAQRRGRRRIGAYERSLSTADYAADATRDALGRWVDGARLLAAERAEVGALLEQLGRAGPEFDVRAVIRLALGPIPQIPPTAVFYAAIAEVELSLYTAYYRDSGARFVIHTGASPAMNRRRIEGGGWRTAVGERIRDLRPELRSDADIARFLGLPTVATSVSHNPEGRTTPGGPRA